VRLCNCPVCKNPITNSEYWIHIRLHPVHENDAPALRKTFDAQNRGRKYPLPIETITQKTLPSGFRGYCIVCVRACTVREETLHFAVLIYTKLASCATVAPASIHEILEMRSTIAVCNSSFLLVFRSAITSARLHRVSKIQGYAELLLLL
jgi:hypothetical protein